MSWTARAWSADCPRVVGLKRLLYERSIQQLVERNVDFRADYVGCLGHCGLGRMFSQLQTPE